MDSAVHRPTKTLSTCAGAVSRQGTRRVNNQDAFLIDEFLNMFVVADGVAGSDGGEIASAIACGQILDVLDIELSKLNANDSGNRARKIEQAIRHCFRAADRRILCERSMEPFLSQMASTALLTYIDTDANAGQGADGRLFVGNAGDSRALLIRSGNATQLTNDHTIAAGMQREGLISEDEAEHHPWRSTLYMHLGGSLYDGPEVFSCDVRDSDRIVLMTDGISRALSNSQIADVVATSLDPVSAAIRVVDEALEHGAGDDVTCVVVEVRWQLATVV